MDNPGYKTTEFWLTAIGNITGSILAIMAAKGLISQEEENLYLQLVEAFAIALIPLAMAFLNWAYIKSRQEVKAAALMARTHNLNQ